MSPERRLWDAAKHPRGPNGKFISTGVGAAKKTAREALSSADHAFLHQRTDGARTPHDSMKSAARKARSLMSRN